jgi:hypothetical protein
MVEIVLPIEMFFLSNSLGQFSHHLIGLRSHSRDREVVSYPFFSVKNSKANPLQ